MKQTSATVATWLRLFVSRMPIFKYQSTIDADVDVDAGDGFV